MLKTIGLLLLAFAAASLGLAILGQCQVHVGVSLSLMFSGLAFALVPWWSREQTVAKLADPSLATPVAPELTVAVESKAIASTVPADFGSIPTIMPEILAPSKGAKTEIRRAYEAYVQICRASGKQAVPPVEFVPLMKTLCSALNIKARRHGELVYLLDVRVDWCE